MVIFIAKSLYTIITIGYIMVNALTNGLKCEACAVQGSEHES